MLGDRVANQAFRRIPPRVMSNRWGSLHEGSTFILKSRDELVKFNRLRNLAIDDDADEPAPLEPMELATVGIPAQHVFL